MNRSQYWSTALVASAVVLSAAGHLRASALSFNSNDTPRALADALDPGSGPHFSHTTNSTAAVSIPTNFGNVRDVDLTVTLNHPALNELQIGLTAPDGTTFAILLENRTDSAGNVNNNVGASGANLSGTTFDSDATRLTAEGSAPYSGHFRPAQSMSAFYDRTPAQATGNWTLSVTDFRSGNTGTLSSWSLTFRNGTTSNFIVTNLQDSGAGSLRQAILDANDNAADSTITFVVPPGMITLTSSELPVTGRHVIMAGPGARTLTISGNHFRRIFNILTGTTEISGLTIADGSSGGPEGGAGINNNGTVVVSECALTGNAVASVNGVAGGAITNSGSLSIYGCTFTGNTSQGGGAIYNAGGTLFVANSTFSENDASFGNAAQGGAISNHASTILSSCTFTDNTADGAGGGVFTDAGTVQVRNTIVAGNNAPVGPDCSGAFSSAGYNLIGKSDGSSGFFNNVLRDQVGTGGGAKDAKFDPAGLTNNGGPTDTWRLLSSSPAIDNGSAAAVSGIPKVPGDQRGYVRPFDAPAIADADDGADIGAFEFGASQLRVISIVRSGNDIVISFDARQGTTYRLERKPALTTATWQSVASAADLTPAGSGPAQLTDQDAITLGKAVYRIRVLP